MTSEEFEELYQLHFKDVYYYILSLSKDVHIAEDITSETFLKALKAIDTFRGDTKLRVWLCQIAKNEYFTFLRKNKRFDSSQNLDDVVEEDVNSIFEKDLIAKDEFITINTILDSSLEEPYGEVFRLRIYRELSFRDIGKLYGKTDNWACVTYHRARKKLQKALEGKL